MAVLRELVINSSEEGGSEDNSIELWMLLDLEEHLRLLQTKGKALHLKNTIIKSLPKCYLENGLSAEVKWRLHMMLESMDGVWLLGQYPKKGSVWLLDTVYMIVKRKYPIDSQAVQHPQPDSSQLVTTFQERLQKWINYADTIKQLHQDLWDMLKYWPQHPAVRKYCVNILRPRPMDVE